jgi:hypothetical protein
MKLRHSGRGAQAMGGSKDYKTKLIEKKDLENGRRKKTKSWDADQTVSAFAFVLYGSCGSMRRGGYVRQSRAVHLVASSYFLLSRSTIEAPIQAISIAIAMNLIARQLS